MLASGECADHITELPAHRNQGKRRRGTSHQSSVSDLKGDRSLSPSLVHDELLFRGFCQRQLHDQDVLDIFLGRAGLVCSGIGRIRRCQWYARQLEASESGKAPSDFGSASKRSRGARGRAFLHTEDEGQESGAKGWLSTTQRLIRGFLSCRCIEYLI